MPSIRKILLLFGCLTLAQLSVATQTSRPGTDPVWPFKSNIYASYLKHARERKIVVPAAFDTYRLTVVPANRRPVVVRIEVRAKSVVIHATLLDGIGGYGATGINKSLDRTLTPIEAETFKRLAKAFDSVSTEQATRGFDGTYWLVEHGGRSYQGSEAWQPDSGALRDLGLYMLELTGWDLGNPSRW